jgi:hypothetical protein
MKKWCCVLLLGTMLVFSAAEIHAEAPVKIPRMLLVGDSWTGFMWGWRSFKGVFEQTPGLEDYVEVGSRTAVMGARAYEFYPGYYNYLQSIFEELDRYPTIDIVTMTLGGNDFMRGGPGYNRWSCTMTPAQETALFNRIKSDIEGIVDAILAVRPDIRVAICGYTYGGRDRGGCSICDQQGGFVGMELAKKAIADSRDRVYYIHNFGLMQYHFGTPALAPGQVPYPGGYPDYTPFPGGAPCQLVHPSALFDGDIHLSQPGYTILAQRCVDEFLGEWLAYPKVFEILLVQNAGGLARFEVTFSEPVSGVDTTDFRGTVPGKAELPVLSVTDFGGGIAYAVTVDSSGAAGTPQLKVVDDDTIVDSGSVPLGGPGIGANQGNGDFSFNGALDFHDVQKPAPQDFVGAMDFLDSNADPYYALLREEGVDMTFAVDTCDLNGGEFSIDPVVIGGNGMLDSLEMALITECYDNPDIDFRSTGGIWHARVVEVYNHNYTQMAIDCGGEEGVINTVLYGIPQMFAGLMTLGDTNSVIVPMVATMALNSSLSESFPIVVNPIVLSRYMPLPTFFGPDGDADGDGYTNRQEYEYFVTSGDYAVNRAAYVAAALNPGLFPGSEGCVECVSNGSGVYEVGADVCLTPPDPSGAGSDFQWSKAGGSLEGRVETTACRWLRLYNIQESDSGVYECHYNDGAKAPAVYTATILVSAGLPVAGPGTLALLAAACGALGVLAQRRKPQTHQGSGFGVQGPKNEGAARSGFGAAFAVIAELDEFGTLGLRSEGRRGTSRR